MTTHLNKAVFVVFLLIAVASANSQELINADPETLGFSAERLNRIDSHFEQCIADGCLPGVVALIVRDGHLAYYKSFGKADIESGKPMDKDAIFRIASMTKPITSVAVMMLYEEGHFLLNDPVSRFIPEFKNPQVLESFNPNDTTYTTKPAIRDITIRDLLTHTSGIGYGFIHEDFRAIYQKEGIPDISQNFDITLAEKMAKLAGLPLMHHPGERFTYGLNTDMLGYLVEVVSGMSFDTFLEKRIFRPLGMKDTHFYLPEDKADRLVTLYRRTDDGYERHTTCSIHEQFPYSDPDYPLQHNRSYLSAGAGLSSTASDYARFLQMLINGGSFDGYQILSPKTIELMTINHVEVGREYGLGFGVRTNLKGGELGSAGTYSVGGLWNTWFWVDPKENLFAVFLSQARPAAYRNTNFQVQIYQAIKDRK